MVFYNAGLQFTVREDLLLQGLFRKHKYKNKAAGGGLDLFGSIAADFNKKAFKVVRIEKKVVAMNWTVDEIKNRIWLINQDLDKFKLLLKEVHKKDGIWEEQLAEIRAANKFCQLYGREFKFMEVFIEEKMVMRDNRRLY